MNNNMGKQNKRNKKTDEPQGKGEDEEEKKKTKLKKYGIQISFL